MSKMRIQYGREFKVMSVELSNGRIGRGVPTKELEIKPSLLYRCGRELETKAETSFPEQGKVIYTPKVFKTLLVSYLIRTIQSYFNIKIGGKRSMGNVANI